MRGGINGNADVFEPILAESGTVETVLQALLKLVESDFGRLCSFENAACVDGRFESLNPFVVFADKCLQLSANSVVICRFAQGV